MPKLAAFVGHSFLQEDEQLIARILGMLTTISTLMPDFEWDHAQAAEPKVLSEKVKEKMRGKNLFIGICTAKEDVADPGTLTSKWWLPRTRALADRTRIRRKASDWVIQEIGMAVGRDMQLILLVEEGVRQPGGLQGDLEYIPFKRTDPERCFDRLSSMLRTLVPAAAAVEPQEQPAQSDANASTLDTIDPVLGFLTPGPTWDGDDYSQRSRLAIRWHLRDAQVRIAEAFQRSPYANNEEAQASFQASEIATRAEIDKQGWIDPLEKLQRKYPNQPAPHAALAERFGSMGEHVRAAGHYKSAAEVAMTAQAKIRFIALAATEQSKSGNEAGAMSLLGEAADILRANPDVEPDALWQIASVWKVMGKDELYFACAERSFELAPDQQEPRFEVAHRYGERSQHAHALFHYRRYLATRDSHAAWNNVGVVSAALKLPVTAISAYKESNRGGNNLAASNIAYAQVEAGFVDEAISTCKEALARPDSDVRLLEALAKCQRARAEEESKETTALEGTVQRREMLRTMGQLSVMPLPNSVPEHWQGPQCLLSACLVGSELTLKGSYKKAAQGLGLTFMEDAKPEVITVTYSGSLVGHTFIGTFKEQSSRPTGQGRGLLSGLLIDAGVECIGTIDKQVTRIELLVKDKERISLVAVAQN